MHQSVKRLIFEDYALVSVNVLYCLPDHRHLVNEFIWQTLDVQPRYPRVQRFLAFWQREIDAKIKEVTLAAAPQTPDGFWRHGIILKLD